MTRPLHRNLLLMSLFFLKHNSVLYNEYFAEKLHEDVHDGKVLRGHVTI